MTRSQTLASHQSRKSMAFAFALLPVCLIVLPFAVFQLCPLGFDALPFFVPLSRLAGELVGAFELPVWTNRLGLGYPLLASLQIPLCYPPFWPLLLLPDPASGLGVYLFAHLVLACCGGIYLGRAVRLSTPAAAVLGVLCSAAAPVVCLLNRPEFAAVSGWSPWIYGALLQQRAGRRAKIAGVAIGMAALVSPQVAGAVVVSALVARFCVPRARQYLWSRPEIMTICLLVAALLGPMLVPFAEFVMWSDRAVLGPAHDNTAMALLPVQLLQGLMPTSLGLCPPGWQELLSLDCEALPRVAQRLWLAVPISGVVALILAIFGLARYRRFRWLGALVLATLLLALPGILPPIAALWNLPPLSMVRFPAKAWEAVWPLLALLGCVGLEGVRGSRKAASWIFLSSACVMLIIRIIPISAWDSLLAGIDAYTAQTIKVHAPAGLILAAIFCASAFLACRMLCGRRLVVAFGCLVAFEALYLGLSVVDGVKLPQRGDNQVASLLRQSLPNSPVPRVSQFWAYKNPVLSSATRFGRGERALTEYAMGGGNALLGEGIALEQAYTGIDLNTYGPLAAALGSKLALRSMLFGSQALLIGSEFRSDSMQPNVTWDNWGLSLYLTSAATRAVVAKHVRSFDSLTALHEALAELRPEYTDTAFVLASEGIQDKAPETAAVRIILDQSRMVSLETTASQQVLVYTRDSLGPGWRVSIDGVGAKPIAVFGALRGVMVPPGTHTVLWEHRATSFIVGCLISVLATLALSVRTLRRKLGCRKIELK